MTSLDWLEKDDYPTPKRMAAKGWTRAMPERQRLDGLRDDDAYVICPCDDERVYFEPLPLEGFTLLPCGMHFLHRASSDDYRIVAEPPQ